MPFIKIDLSDVPRWRSGCKVYVGGFKTGRGVKQVLLEEEVFAPAPVSVPLRANDIAIRSSK